MKRIGTAILTCAMLLSLSWAQTNKAKKPLSPYKTIVVTPFVVETSDATKDFPTGEEANLRLSAIDTLRTSGMFEKVLEAAPEQTAPDTPAKEEQRSLHLSTTIIGFQKGDSAARFMTWPLPVGVSKVKVRFSFLDSLTKETVCQFEQEAKFQATISAGIATQQQQMAHLKSALADALTKQIKRNR
jgi:hypothetical protein